jgi:FkbH-like protein
VHCSFLNHIWEFDRFQVTEEDMQRNKMYKVEKQRKEEQVNYEYFDDFLQSLNINVNLKPLKEKDLDRAVQLTIRTNQFNLNGIRKTREEIIKVIHQDNTYNQIINVKDRFGDYGIAGLLLATQFQNTLVIDTFLLSCRVLGRNVEEVVMAQVQEYCTSEGLDTIIVHFTPTSKNQPFIEFLVRTNWLKDNETNMYSFLINKNQFIAEYK